MPLKNQVFVIAAALLVSSGCAITYPVLDHEKRDYVGKTLTVKNPAHLVTSSDSNGMDILSRSPCGDYQNQSEIPIGTEITIQSFWRTRRWYLIGGLETSDHAKVSVVTPSGDRVRASLSTSTFDDVFDGDKYRPKPALDVD